MRPSCPSSHATTNGRLLIVRLTCPTSPSLPQDTSDPGERLIDARRNFRKLCVIAFAPAPVEAARVFELGHGSLQSFDCYFELGHHEESGSQRLSAV